MRRLLRLPALKALLLIFWLSCSSPGSARPARVVQVAERPAAITSIREEDGPVIVLSLAENRTLPQPLIQFLPGENGQVYMVADFQGVVWPGRPQLRYPANSQISQARLGQFQPGTFRLALRAGHHSVFAGVDFQGVPGQLRIRLPANVQDKPRPTDPVSDGGRSIAALSCSSRRPASNPLPAPSRAGSAPPRSASPLPHPAYASASGPVPAPAPPAGAVPAPAPSIRSAPVSAYDTGTGSTAYPGPPAGAAGVASAGFLPAAASHTGTARVSSNGAGSASTHFVPAAERASGRGKEPALAAAAPLESQGGSTGEAPPQAAPAIVKHGAAPLSHHSYLRNVVDSEGRIEIDPPAGPRSRCRVRVLSTDPFRIALVAPGKIATRSFKLAEPWRYVIDVADVPDLADAEVPALPENPLVRALRVGTPDGFAGRLVLDLSSDRVTVLEKIDEQNSTLIVEAWPATTPGAAPVLPGAVIVLDAGHGGSDPGAQRGGIQEKELTLSIVEKLRRHLEAQGARVVLTRSDDRFVSLEERVQLTNSIAPAAFVSVHINAMESNDSITGIETYYQNDASRELAQAVHAALVSRLRAPDRSVRKASFYVINHTRHPAILAEVGFISNRQERLKLARADYQNQVALALAEGVKTYLASHKQDMQGTLSQGQPSGQDKGFTQILHTGGTLASR